MLCILNYLCFSINLKFAKLYRREEKDQNYDTPPPLFNMKKITKHPNSLMASPAFENSDIIYAKRRIFVTINPQPREVRNSVYPGLMDLPGLTP